MEDADGYKARHGGWNKTNVDRACRIFLEGIAKAGYYPMLYAGFEEMNNYISSEVWNKYDIWFPHWAAKCGYAGKNLCMWQYGGETNKLESNSIPGVGVIDKNICYKDYPTIIKQGGYNGWPKTGSTATSTTKTAVTEAQLRQSVANIINSWLGAKEGDSVHAEILRIYNAQNPLPVGYKNAGARRLVCRYGQCRLAQSRYRSVHGYGVRLRTFPRRRYQARHLG